MPGWIRKPHHFKDWNLHKVYGSPEPVPILPLGRDISKVPITHQGSENTCVSCTVTWIKMWMEASGVDLSHEFLASISGTTERGAEADWVLQSAKYDGICDQASWDKQGYTSDLLTLAEEHKIAAYAYPPTLSKQNIYHALCIGPIMVGVDDWEGVGPHMMAGFDVSADGTKVRCGRRCHPF